MEKRKGGFLQGLLVGLIITCIISVCANYFAINYVKEEFDKKYEKALAENNAVVDNDTDNSSNSSSNSTSNVKLDTIYQLINTYYLEEYKNEDLQEGIYKGLMNALNDPYSVYYTKEEYNELKEQTSGLYVGVGVQVSQNNNTKVITVTKVFKNSPGEEAGLLPGDIIVDVAGTDVTSMDLNECVNLIKGKSGTFVEIKVYRESISDYVTVKAERRQIEIPTVEYEMLEGNMGYIILSSFDEVTSKQFKSALDELRAQGAKGLIVDLRSNPGGLLTSVNEILRNILPKGRIVYTEDKNGKQVTYDCDGKNELDIPMVVLINGDSASAAEIFAGAVKDYEKATLVGTTTYGKGIVQSLIPLKDGSAVKITVSKYYTPKGINIHKTGIAPDVEVELNEEVKYLVTIPHDKDNQLQKAIEVLKEKMN